ncbi:MAG: ATP-grasp domain-containing protein [Pseudomonadota bacterium]
MSCAVLLTLGRLPKGLELARCLNAAGCTVYVADPFGTHLSKPSRAVAKSFKVTAPNTDSAGFLSDLKTIIRNHNIDLVIPVSEEVPHVAQLHGQLPDTVRVLCPEIGQLMRLHDKFQFIDAVRQAGLPAPETHHGDDPAALELASQSDVVVKPALGCSGTGLHFITQGEGLPSTLRTPSNVIQKRVHGQEISSFTVARDGQVQGTALYQGLIFAGTVATLFERITGLTAVEEWIARFVKAENYSGFIAFDFIVEESGAAFPIECNPRLTSGIHFLDHMGLAGAILSDNPISNLDFKPYKRMQEGHTSLTKAYAALPNVKAFVKRLGLVFTSRDVLWSWRDPLPFLLMTPMSWPVLSQVMFKGLSFGEAATKDVEWLPKASVHKNAA